MILSRSGLIGALLSVFLLAESAAGAELISGMGALSGKVTAPTNPGTAKVYAWNSARQIGFSVWVADGRYRAVNLFPGTYEVTVSKSGLSTETAKVVVTAGDTATVDFAMKDAPVVPTYVNGRTLEFDTIESYDDIYPPGPGRDLLEKTCIYCHGVNFLSGRPQPRESWATAIDTMTTGNAFGLENEPSIMDPARISADDREILLDYLGEHLGFDKPIRAVKDEGKVKFDEAALGKAMIVEYWFPNTEAMPNRWTQETHFDADGNVWVTERGRGSPGIVRLDPRTGEYRDYPAPIPRPRPTDLP